MTVVCSQCSLENPDHSGFCARCGTRLEDNHSDNNPSMLLTAPSDEVMQSFPFPSTPTPESYQPSPPPTMYAPPDATPPPPPLPVTTQIGKRAFAGYGTPIAHNSWLLADQQPQAMTMFTALRDGLIQRGVAGLNINQLRLFERGFVLESRDYLTVHRGSSTVFVYVTPAGRDLFISRTTTVQTPISYIRSAVLTILLIIMIYGFTQQATPPAAGSAFSVGGAIATLAIFFSYPLLVFFLVFVVASLIAWIINGDISMYLRPGVMNDFQADDVALAEEIVDTSLRDAAQTARVGADKIAPPSQGYRTKRRFRLI